MRRREHRNGLTKNSLEGLEPRLCLAAITLASHDVVYSELVGPRSVVAGDVDQDGDLDLVSASRAGVMWHENLNGQVDFSRMHVVTDRWLTRDSDVLLADLDGDGDLDVLAASNYVTGWLVWYENLDGKGHFARGGAVAADSGFVHVAAADVDGDGDVDIIGATTTRTSYASQRMVWYENVDNSGTFNPAQVISSRGANSLEMADLDHDGDMDLLPGTDAWYENTSTEGRVSWEKREVVTDLSDLGLVTASDLDGDGDLDVVGTDNYTVFGYGDGAILWIENLDGRGELGQPRVFNTGPHLAGPLAVADVDGDGDADVLSAIQDNDQAALLWFENGDGRGTMNPGRALPGYTDSVVDLIAVDINQDLQPDLVVVSTNDAIAYYLNQDEQNRFGDRQIVITGSYGDDTIQLLDVDDDRDLDIVAGVSWFENRDGRGNFTELRKETPEWARGQAVDLDGDGDLDRVSLLRLPFDPDILSSRYEVVWFENLDGRVQYARRDRIDDRDDYDADREPFMMDFDADGDQDIVWASSSSVAWYDNTDGRGTFSEARRIPLAGDGGFDVVLPGDLNNDGRSDLLFVTFRNAYWYEIVEKAVGPPHTITTDVTSGPSAHLVDLDNDGDQDLLLASGTNGPPQWLKNDGAGNFSEPITIDNIQSNVVVPADVDLDGDLDVISYSNQRHIELVAWHENRDGRGDFGPIGSHRVIARTTANTIVAADFDGDGDLDVATQSSWLGFATYNENLNGKDFGNERVLRDFNSQIQFAAGDLDGDGDADLAMVARETFEPRNGRLGRYTIRWYQDRLIGDANGDGRFDSKDLIKALAAGKYDDGIGNNATFDEGDWNQDGDFGNDDLILAMAAGHYEAEVAATRLMFSLDLLFSEEVETTRPLLIGFQDDHTDELPNDQKLVKKLFTLDN